MQSFFLRISALLLCSLPISVYAISDAELQQAADAVNQQAPMMIDQHTRLDGADAGMQSLTYKYTLVNYTAEQMDGEKFTQGLRPALLESGCDALKPLLSQGVRVHYSYRGKNASEIASVTLTAADCDF